MSVKYIYFVYQWHSCTLRQLSNKTVEQWETKALGQLNNGTWEQKLNGTVEHL